MTTRKATIRSGKQKIKKSCFFNHANLLPRIFNSYGDFNIANGELHCFTQTCHSRPLRSGGSLTCYAYCNTCRPFILGNFEESSHSPMLPSDWQWSCHYHFSDLGLWRPGADPNFPHARQTLYQLSHRSGLPVMIQSLFDWKIPEWDVKQHRKHTEQTNKQRNITCVKI